MRKFEKTQLNYLSVVDDSNNCIGIYYLEDFCNDKSYEAEIDIEGKNIIISDEEKKLLEDVIMLSHDEKYYIKNKILHEIGESFVCCCDEKETALNILKQILDIYADVRYVDSVLDIKDEDNVLFLSYKKIKLYRKGYNGKIKFFCILNKLVSESKNHEFFYKKYPELMQYLSDMGILFLYGIIPDGRELKGLSCEMRKRILGYGKINYDVYADILGGNGSKDYIATMVQNKLSNVVNNGMYKMLQDCKSDFYNVVSGMRVTFYQPTTYKNTVYLFGPCTARGALVSDENTVASFIQKKINEYDLPYVVMNCGVGGGTDVKNTYKYILSLPIRPGDIILLLEEGQFIDESDIDNVSIFKLSKSFNNSEMTGDWFLDRPAHCNLAANKIIADEFYERMLPFLCEDKKESEKKIVNKLNEKQKYYDYSEELKKYINEVISIRFDSHTNDVIGSITMHCNPMTKGHKYLIDTALKQVDYLYIFILSEDVSEIPYNIRKDILEHETRMYSNVKIIDCGKFMASKETFPEYFKKESSIETRVDASKDIMTFCNYIAPVLGIKKRFVGTEKRDFVTRQYNNQLKIILPMYGIELCEIERLSIDNSTVSAHTIRNLIKNNKYIEAKYMMSEYAFQKVFDFYNEKINYKQK